MPREERSVVAIDPDRLDQEVLGHPDLVLEHSEQLADLKYAHARAKADFERVEAETFLAARETPSEYNLPEKPTVDAIKAAVIASRAYQTAQQKVFTTKHDQDMCEAVVSALQHRKSNLQDYVQLVLTDWNSKVKLPALDRGRMDDQRNRRVESKIDKFRPNRDE